MLWKVLALFGCPASLIQIIKEFHDGTKGRVVVGARESEAIEVGHGTKQGCVLAPTLFTLFLTVVLTILHQEIQEGVYIYTRSDGGLFNLARLKAKTKTTKALIRELLFADDTALVAHNPAQIQRMLDSFSEASRKMGLQINISKTELMYQPDPSSPTQNEPRITISGEALKVVQTFKYLGNIENTGLFEKTGTYLISPIPIFLGNLCW